MKRMKTNLEFFLHLFGWQGGTIHQVSYELRAKGLSPELTSVSSLLSMNENAREVIKALYLAKAAV